MPRHRRKTRTNLGAYVGRPSVSPPSDERTRGTARRDLAAGPLSLAVDAGLHVVASELVAGRAELQELGGVADGPAVGLLELLAVDVRHQPQVGFAAHRALVVDLDPDTGARRSPVLKALGVYRHLHGEVVFGVDAVVTQPGRVRPGVPVDIVGRS